VVSRYIVDFITLDGKLIVEVDGGTHSMAEELVRDEARTKELERLGFHVMRVTNSDVYQNLEGVLATILSELDGA
jgi:very-short-patch-repair endonuclease